MPLELADAIAPPEGPQKDYLWTLNFGPQQQMVQLVTAACALPVFNSQYGRFPGKLYGGV